MHNQQPLKRDTWEPRSRMIDGREVREREGRIKRTPESNCTAHTPSSPFLIHHHQVSCQNRSGHKAKRNRIRHGSDPYDIEYNLTLSRASRTSPLRPRGSTFEYRRGGPLGICPWSGSSPGTTKRRQKRFGQRVHRERELYARFDHQLHPRLVPHDSDHLAPPSNQQIWKEPTSSNGREGEGET